MVNPCTGPAAGHATGAAQGHLCSMTHIEVGCGEPRLQALRHCVLREGALQVDEVLQVGTSRWEQLRTLLGDGYLE